MNATATAAAVNWTEPDNFFSGLMEWDAIKVPISLLPNLSRIHRHIVEHVDRDLAWKPFIRFCCQNTIDPEDTKNAH
jgi:hypothetical protein